MTRRLAISARTSAPLGASLSAGAEPKRALSTANRRSSKRTPLAAEQAWNIGDGDRKVRHQVQSDDATDNDQKSLAGRAGHGDAPASRSRRTLAHRPAARHRLLAPSQRPKIWPTS